MTYCAARSEGSWRSCSPDPWGALRHGIRPIVPPMNAYIMSCMGCTYTIAFARFVSVETSTSDDAETFNLIFIFDTKGLIVFLGHFQPYCLTRKMHFHYVASRHAFDFCAGLKTKYSSLIKIMFPLHALYPGCSYFYLG